MKKRKKSKLNKMMLDEMKDRGLSHQLALDLLLKHNREINDQLKLEADTEILLQTAEELIALESPHYYRDYVSVHDLFMDVYRWTGIRTDVEQRENMMRRMGYINSGMVVTIDKRGRPIWRNKKSVANQGYAETDAALQDNFHKQQHR